MATSGELNILGSYVNASLSGHMTSMEMLGELTILGPQVPAADGVFDGADFEKFLHDRIKIDGKAGQLADSVKISRDGKIVSL